MCLLSHRSPCPVCTRRIAQFEKLRQPIHIRPHRASIAAIKAVEATGGSVTTVYHNKLSFAQACKPERFEGHLQVREALPMKKRDILYYTNWSVFWKIPCLPRPRERVAPGADQLPTCGFTLQGKARLLGEEARDGGGAREDAVSARSAQADAPAMI